MPPFHADLADVLQRATAAGVRRIISVGIDLNSSREAILLARDHPEVSATVGCHPHEAAAMNEKDLAALAYVAHHNPVVAIGEIGLDYYRNLAPRESQLNVLKEQLKIADGLDLPVVVHCRQAEADMMPILHGWTAGRTSSHPPGVIHCFNGSASTAKEYLGMGFLLSLGAYIGYPTSAGMRATLKGVPAERLMLETDSPYLPPQSRRGKRNEPAYTVVTLGLLSEIRGVSEDVLAEQTTRNAVSLFRLPA
jgi:TatD DNase family protein